MTEDKLTAKRETEEKRDRQLKDYEDRLREINDGLRKKNLCLIGIPQGTKRARGPESVFEQIIELKTSLTWGGKQAFRSRR